MPLKAAIVPVTPFQQNCTLLWDEASKQGVVVDPGGDLDRIEAGIKKTGMTVEKIALIRLPDRHPVRKSWPVALRE